MKYQDAFQSIKLNDGTEYACNKEGQGVFIRTYKGTWIQISSTRQTPVFRSPQQFRKWLGDKYVTTGVGLRMASYDGWRPD